MIDFIMQEEPARLVIRQPKRAKIDSPVFAGDPEELKRAKWAEVKEAKLPEPLEFSSVDYLVTEDESIREIFRETGLQVIVRISGVELTPEQPEVKIGGWRVSQPSTIGQMERSTKYICG